MEKYTKNIFFWVEKVIDEYLLKYKTQTNISYKVFNRIRDMSIRGKCVRGNLFCAGLSMFGSTVDEKAYKVAAAIEIIQTSLLIHDDIMDEDKERRGISAFHEQFKSDIHDVLSVEANQYGISMGIGAGDIGFFMAVQTMLNSEYPLERRVKMIDFCSEEIVTVGVGQSIDVSLPYMQKPQENDVITAYRYKTGRYTIFMPLYMAHIISDVKEDFTRIKKWAEEVGILYQLRDDYLNLFGDSIVSGKPKGTDIFKKKRTWWLVKLMKKLNIKDQIKIKKIYSEEMISNNDVEFIYEYIKKYQIKEDLELCIFEYKRKAEIFLKDLPVGEKYVKQLKEFTIFVSERNS